MSFIVTDHPCNSAFRLKTLNIAFLELFPIALSLHLWGGHVRNQCVSFFTDNAALVDTVNQQSSKHSLIMVLVRDLVLTS